MSAASWLGFCCFHFSTHGNTMWFRPKPRSRMIRTRQAEQDRIQLAVFANRAHPSTTVEAMPWRKGDPMTTVATILAVKGRDVVTTQPHRTIAEVASLLADKGIGAVLV